MTASRRNKTATSIEGHLYDVIDYGAKSDLRRTTNCSISASSSTVTSDFLASNGDSGKLVLIRGAGASLLTNTNGSMSTSVAKDANVLTGSGFTSALVGRSITITGVGAAAATLKTVVSGVTDSTHLRTIDACSTSASSQTYHINEDLYATSTASSATTLTLDTTAGITVSGAEIWLGTDDATAINNAIVAAITAATDGWTVLLRGAHAIGSSIRMRPSGTFNGGPGKLMGYGAAGYSAALSHGTTRIKPMKADLVAVSNCGITDGMGIKGAMTSGSAVFTDATASFPSGSTMVGKTVIVLGAGTQAGSMQYYPLITTVVSRDSATQLTLAATASTTVTDAIYSYNTTALNALGGDGFENIHIEGSCNQRCGLAIIDDGGGLLENITISDFRSGVGLLSSGGAGWNANVETKNLNVVDCYKGIVLVDTSVDFDGFTNVDGHSNLLSSWPGVGTVGIIAVQAGITAAPSINVQAVETWGIFEGDSRVQLMAARTEHVPEGMKFHSNGVHNDGSYGLDGSRINCVSWSASNLNLTGLAKGLTATNLGSDFTFDPGFYLDSEWDMYGNVDASSLANMKVSTGQIAVKNGLISDSSFPHPPQDGAYGFDYLHNLFFARFNGVWGYSTLATSLAGRIKQLDWDQQYLTSTVSTLTVPAGGVPAGKFVIVGITIDGIASTPTLTVTDSKSNSYNTDSQANQTGGSQKLHSAIASAKITTPLVAGDTITVTSGTSADGMDTVAFEYQGLATSSWLDQNNHGTGTSGTALSSGNITTTQNVETVIAVHANGDGIGANGTLTLAAGWESIYSTSHQGGILMTVAEKLLFGTATLAATATASKNQDWASAIASYKAA